MLDTRGQAVPICGGGGGPRVRHVYLSDSHRLDVSILGKQHHTAEDPYFLIGYQGKIRLD